MDVILRPPPPISRGLPRRRYSSQRLESELTGRALARFSRSLPLRPQGETRTREGTLFSVQWKLVACRLLHRTTPKRLVELTVVVVVVDPPWYSSTIYGTRVRTNGTIWYTHTSFPTLCHRANLVHVYHNILCTRYHGTYQLVRTVPWYTCTIGTRVQI
jgi:hypothetical protein